MSVFKSEQKQSAYVPLLYKTMFIDQTYVNKRQGFIVQGVGKVSRLIIVGRWFIRQNTWDDSKREHVVSGL
jgi:hypothetical protein